VQTLDFKPYRVDLTPFAGLLADGNSHVVALSVYNADSYFLATANLLVFTDHGAAQVSGGLLGNTLTTAPTPVVTENIQQSGSTFTGSITVSSDRNFAISGYLNTSHGRVDTTVEQSVRFLNTQVFDVSPTVDGQNARQTTSVDSLVTTSNGWGTKTREQHFSYPLVVDYRLTFNADGSSSQVTSVEQQDHLRTSDYGDDSSESALDEEVKSTDTLLLSPSFSITGNSGAVATHSYRSTDSSGRCYSRTLTAQMQKLTAVQGGGDCGGDDAQR
jgi:hypothetical protein